MLGTGIWLSAKEIADLALPGLPGNKRKIAELIAIERWALRTGADGRPLNRQRAGRGGGWEWHSSLLPERARAELVRRGLIAAPVAVSSNVVAMPAAKSTPAAAMAWAAFERRPATAQKEARRRLAAIDAIDRHVAAGATKTRAIETVAEDYGVGVSTLNNWLAMVAGVARPDRLAHLAPATKGGGKTAEIDPEIWDLYRADWLRFEKPTHASCHGRVARIAKARGVKIPSAKTFQRRIEKEIPPEVILACREGRERVAQIVPAQIRSTAHLHALEAVNIDGHVWDVMVLWPDGTTGRPITVGIQDLYSRKMLAWRTDRSESAVLTRLAFADLFRNFGVPRACYLDNGRAFASKWISGGTPTRFRFKIKHDEPLGLLPALGIETHFVKPYAGQSKPIERAWRDFASDIAKCPDFAGAYTGKDTVSKPENYGTTAIPFATFERVIAREIAALNAKMGRRTENANGRSFDQVFEASIAAGAPIGRASEAHLRLALLAADQKFADRRNGAIELGGNLYWAEGMLQFAGQRLTIRFDPDDLHRSIFAYDAKGALIAELPIWEKTGFDDMAAAKLHAKRKADFKKAVKASIEAERRLQSSDVANALAALGETESEMPDPQVIRPVRSRDRRAAGGAAAAAAPLETPEVTEFNDRFRRASAMLRLVD